MEQFLWRDRLFTADSEISQECAQESAKGSGVVHKSFFPFLHFMKTSLSTLTQMKTLTQRAFEDRISSLLVWSVLDDALLS